MGKFFKGVFALGASAAAAIFIGKKLKGLGQKLLGFIADIEAEKVANLEVIPCQLMMVTEYGAEKDEVQVDFSRYDETGIVGFSRRLKRGPQTMQESELEGKVTIFPMAAVWKVAEGLYNACSNGEFYTVEEEIDD